MLVVPIKPGAKDFDSIAMNQIRNIVGPGNEKNILTDALEGSFESLNAVFEEKIANHICDQYACAYAYDATMNWSGGDEGSRSSRLYTALVKTFTARKKSFPTSKDPFS